jgi:hypothetical protein
VVSELIFDENEGFRNIWLVFGFPFLINLMGGIRVVSGWYQGGIRVVSGWYQGGIKLQQSKSTNILKTSLK